MAKKRKVVPRSHGKNKKRKPYTSMEIDRTIRAIVNDIVLPIEQRLNLLYESLQTMKANVVTCNTVLERGGVLNREEFMKECEDYQRLERAGANDDGSMDGAPVFSLYNVEI